MSTRQDSSVQDRKLGCKVEQARAVENQGSMPGANESAGCLCRGSWQHLTSPPTFSTIPLSLFGINIPCCWNSKDNICRNYPEPWFTPFGTEQVATLERRPPNSLCYLTYTSRWQNRASTYHKSLSSPLSPSLYIDGTPASPHRMARDQPQTALRG